MFDRLLHHLDRIRAPELDWLQVEVTTCCNAKCCYCPHGALPEGLPKKHMPLDLFRQLVPFMDNVQMIYLQGWGEPLLHPDLFKIIKFCKEKGKSVGFTTNGTQLTRENISRIIESGVDILGVSFAGTKAKTHNDLRTGNDFETIVANLVLLQDLKQKNDTQCPDVHMAYLMLKSNFHELDEVVPLARKIGARQIVVSHPALILNEYCYSEALFNNQDLHGECSRILASTKEQAQQRNILFSSSEPYLAITSINCSENVSAACVVNVDGEVSPCVFTNPVLGNSGQSSFFYKSQKFPIKGISFGNIKERSLTRIWLSRKYADFRMTFDPEAVIMSPDVLPPIQEQCAHCYKRLVVPLRSGGTSLGLRKK